uniref:Uncharacterized protein n=1 Tax=Glossina palpalis gambiensis TaxID=67801 RepID=A0A1B0BKQ3_9MUSC
MDDQNENENSLDNDGSKPEKMFTLKKWNAVCMWSWDVECDICAICRVQVMDNGLILANDDIRRTRPIILRSISSRDLP